MWLLKIQRNVVMTSRGYHDKHIYALSDSNHWSYRCKQLWPEEVTVITSHAGTKSYPFVSLVNLICFHQLFFTKPITSYKGKHWDLWFKHIHIFVYRNFLTCSGTIRLEAKLNSPVYRPEEDIQININKSSRDIKRLKVKVVQVRCNSSETNFNSDSFHERIN